jgi:hypothetical protein
MKRQAEYCAVCWCKLSPGEVVWQRLDGKLVCEACFYGPPVVQGTREGAYTDGR